MAVEQRLQISELQFDKFPTPSSLMYWNMRFKNQVSSCSDFPLEAMLWIQKIGDGRFSGWIKILAISCWQEFPEFWTAGTRELLLHRTRSYRIPTSRRRSVWRNRKLSKRIGFFKEDRSLAWFTTAFRVTGAHDTVLDYVDLFSVTLRNDNVQDFDTRWDQILLSMPKIPTDDVLESLYKLRIRESDQVTSVLELYDMEIHQKISMSNCQKLKTMVKRSKNQKLSVRNFDAGNNKIVTGAVVKSRRGLSGIERGKGNLLSVESNRSVFERRPMQFPTRESWSCKTDTKSRSILWANNTERWKCVEKKDQRQESVWEDQSTAVQRLLERYLYYITL